MKTRKIYFNKIQDEHLDNYILLPQYPKHCHYLPPYVFFNPNNFIINFRFTPDPRLQNADLVSLINKEDKGYPFYQKLPLAEYLLDDLRNFGK